MKVLYIGNVPNSKREISTFSSMWKFHLKNALAANGVELVPFPEYENGVEPFEYADNMLSVAEKENCDHILYVGVRPFTQIPLCIGEYVKERFNGLVCHTYDGSMLDCPQVDVTFTVRDDTWKYVNHPSRMQRHMDNNWLVGWAADDEQFYPERVKDGKLRVFLDHPLFDLSGWDYSLTLAMNLKNIPVPHETITLEDKGLKILDENDISIREYHRGGVSTDEFSAALRKCDIFIVTHRESLGLTVLEAAKCGALVVTPDNLIPQDRLDTVEHVILTSSKIDWDSLLKSVDSKACTERVVNCTWDNVAKNLIDGIKHMEKRKCL